MRQAKIPKTTLAKKEEVQKTSKWLLIDATGKTLGRLASEASKILRGKHKPQFTPHVDTGDGLIIIHAEKVHLTGAKEQQKTYRYYTGFMSGEREIPCHIMRARKPEYLLWHAIKGMMPKTRLSNAQLKKLRIFAGEQHDMQAQQPIQVHV